MSGTSGLPLLEGCDEIGPWRKASDSGGNGCVEVARTAGNGVAVRDTKDRDGAVLRFTAQEWLIFLAGVKGAEFDL